MGSCDPLLEQKKMSVDGLDATGLVQDLMYVEVKQRRIRRSVDVYTKLAGYDGLTLRQALETQSNLLALADNFQVNFFEKK